MSDEELSTTMENANILLDLHNRITGDRTACFIEEAVNRGILPKDMDLFTLSAALFDGPLRRNYRKAAYFYNRMIEENRDDVHTTMFIRNRLSNFYATGKGSIPEDKDKDKARHLMKPTALYWLLWLSGRAPCEEKVIYKNTYPLYIMNLDAPWLIIETQEWLKNICSLSPEELNRLGTKYLGAKNVPSR